MIKGKSFLAIIPARAGSKRLPKKNHLILAKKPLIEWTIEAAKKSKYIDDIVVSSDDKKILNIAKKMKVIAQERPSEISTDSSSSAECVEYVLKNLLKNYDYLIFLQPTSPLRTVLDIDSAIKKTIDLKASSITSVTESEHNPLWTATLPEDDSINNFISKNIREKRGQDLPVFYRLNGAIYIVKVRMFIKNKNLIQKKGYAHIMPQERSIDIDTKLDFLLASSIISAKIDRKI